MPLTTKNFLEKQVGPGFLFLGRCPKPPQRQIIKANFLGWVSAIHTQDSKALPSRSSLPGIRGQNSFLKEGSGRGRTKGRRIESKN